MPTINSSSYKIKKQINIILYYIILILTILVLNLPNKNACLNKAKNPFLLSSSSIDSFIISNIDFNFISFELFSSFKLSYKEISISSTKVLE